MNVNKYLLVFIIAIAAFLAPIIPVDAVCNGNRIDVFTNIQDASVTIKAPVNMDSAIAKKTLALGETWYIGSGYSLTVQTIDARTTPRQTWLVFSRNGVQLDEKILSVGQTYSYSDIFSAYIDAIFAGATDMMQLRYIYFLSQPYFWETNYGTTSLRSGGQWYWESNDIYFSSYGSWTVSYGNVEGYLTPANETKSVAGNNCIEFTGVYSGGDIMVTSNIAEASFTVSGPGGYSKSGSSTSWSDQDVRGGSYTVTFVDVSGYITPQVQTKFLSPGSTVYFSGPYVAIPPTGSISVSSSPSGASIYIDGSYQGTSPKTLTGIPAGSHTITLKLTGYQDWSQNVNVVTGQTSEISVPLDEIPGSISVSSSPTGASIYLDGTYKGNTSTTLTNIASGSHTITLKLTGYQDCSQRVNVIAGQKNDIFCPLAIAEPPKVPETVSMDVSSSPSGASIYLDGSYQGITPKTLTDITAGSHNITLKLSGYKDWFQSFDLSAGKKLNITPLLLPVQEEQTPLPPAQPPQQFSSIIYIAIIMAIGVLIIIWWRNKPVKPSVIKPPKPIEEYEKCDIFLSYSSRDLKRAKIIIEALEKKGFSVWWDTKIPPGTTFDEFIEKNLKATKCVIALWSNNSILSNWVKEEALYGRKKGILIPVLIDDVEIPFGFSRLEAARLINWDGNPNSEFDLLLKSITNIVGC
jgi:hypothetical protein